MHLVIITLYFNNAHFLHVILKETLKTIVKAQNRDLESSEYGVQRVLTKKIDLKVPFAIILSGIRRCGKSTLLRQVMRQRAVIFFNSRTPRATSSNLAISRS